MTTDSTFAANRPDLLPFGYKAGITVAIRGQAEGRGARKTKSKNAGEPPALQEARRASLGNSRQAELYQIVEWHRWVRNPIHFSNRGN